MIFSLIATMVLLMALMLAWIEVQRMARHVSEQHPEFGPLRLVGGGCGGQGHGEDRHGAKAAAALGPKMNKPVAAPAEGCASCDNTACKPGAPLDTACAEPQLPH
jgi:hypothetical protein